MSEEDAKISVRDANFRFATNAEIREYVAADALTRTPSLPLKYSHASRNADMAFFAELKRLGESDYNGDSLLALAHTNFWTEVDENGCLVLFMQIDQHAEDDTCAAETLRIARNKLNCASTAAREMARSVAFRLWLSTVDIPQVANWVHEKNEESS